MVPGTTFTFTALYTGSLGNQVGLALAAGSKANTWRLTVTLPGLQPEVYDNIAGTGAAFWTALAAAVNQGQGPQRGPSQLVVANAGGVTATPAAFTIALGSGTAGADGALAITAGLLVGNDIPPRTGMYALRGQGCGIALLADADDPSQWTTQAGFGLQEGIYMILTGPAGDTILNALAAKQPGRARQLRRQADVRRLAVVVGSGEQHDPPGLAAGLRRRTARQSLARAVEPEQAAVWRDRQPEIGHARVAGKAASYSAADLAALLGAGIDVIANPQPGGSFWGVRGGHNSASNPAVNGDNYTRLTNYIAATLAAGMGQYVGQVINATLFQRIRATQLSFLQNMLGQGLLGSTDGSLPFSVVCDTSNNPASRTGLGYVQSDAQVQYQAINEKFIVNMEGGQTVQVSRQTLPTGQPA